MRANQLRLWFASFAYVMLEASRCLACTAPNWRLTVSLHRTLKIGALVRISVRRIHVSWPAATSSSRMAPHTGTHACALRYVARALLVPARANLQRKPHLKAQNFTHAAAKRASQTNARKRQLRPIK